MSITFTDAAATSILSALLTAMDAGAGPALCVIYSGNPPLTAQSALSGNTVLANVALSDPSATVLGKTLTFSGMPKYDASANNTGIATFFRIHVSADGLTPGAAVIQGTCGTFGADMIVASTTITAGEVFQITSITLTLL